MICNLIYEVKVRRWTCPLIAIGSYTGWDWLIDKCISIEVKTVPIVPEC